MNAKESVGASAADFRYRERKVKPANELKSSKYNKKSNLRTEFGPFRPSARTIESKYHGLYSESIESYFIQ